MIEYDTPDCVLVKYNGFEKRPVVPRSSLKGSAGPVAWSGSGQIQVRTEAHQMEMIGNDRTDCVLVKYKGFEDMQGVQQAASKAQQGGCPERKWPNTGAHRRAPSGNDRKRWNRLCFSEIQGF